MNVMAKQTDTDGKKSNRWYVLAACALSGAVAGYVTTDLLTGGANGEPLLALTWSQGAALLVAGIILFSLAIVAIGFGIPRAGIAMKMFEDVEEWRDERTMMWLSCLGGGAWALAMILLAFAEPLGMIGSAPALAGMGALVIGATYFSWRLLREYDELWLGINAETCTYGMYLTFLIGGVWSIAAHLGFIPALAPLDWITLLTTTCIAGAIWATRNRGMLED